jgi:hypothetical protein
VKQRIQLAGAFECEKVVAAAHMVVANEDLWNRSPSACLHHFLATRWFQIDADLFQPGHALMLQQLLGADAIGAGASGIHANMRLHDHFLLRLTGWPAFCHSIMPPRRL